jgi:hypothetical protein
MTMQARSLQCMRWKRYARAAVLMTMALASLAGCGTVQLMQPVQPWEKGTLARREMAFDSDRLEGKFDEHIYTSKEAASGGSGVGGGGCGCN